MKLLGKAMKELAEFEEIKNRFYDVCWEIHTAGISMYKLISTTPRIKCFLRKNGIPPYHFIKRLNLLTNTAADFINNHSEWKVYESLNEKRNHEEG